MQHIAIVYVKLITNALVAKAARGKWALAVVRGDGNSM